jgi:acyl-[acyl-carrier-protein]-phospholipid O-acyltransferase / long-chain-fatty-acid--[acyl-carrier-protein] ligase
MRAQGSPMNAGPWGDRLTRLTCRLVARTLFRIEIRGRENIPRRGPALLAANHLTHLDAFLIGSCVDPAVRFLIWKPYYDQRLLTWALRIARAIPIETRPHSLASSIEQARRELQAGSVVCIFAEGAISRTGVLQPFKRGIEAIVRGRDVPIVPVHLDGLWESIFSMRGEQPFARIPRHLRHPVSISFGAPMPSGSTAGEVREAVGQLAK